MKTKSKCVILNTETYFNASENETDDDDLEIFYNTTKIPHHIPSPTACHSKSLPHQQSVHKLNTCYCTATLAITYGYTLLSNFGSYHHINNSHFLTPTTMLPQHVIENGIIDNKQDHKLSPLLLLFKHQLQQLDCTEDNNNDDISFIPMAIFDHRVSFQPRQIINCDDQKTPYTITKQ